MITAEQLEQFGLSLKEAKVYLASLQMGPASVQTIAEQAGIHRVSVYDILQSLIDKGFVNQIAQGKKRYLEALEPNLVLESLRLKEKTFFNLLPELKAVQSKGTHKPKVLYFEGRENVWKAYLDRIRHTMSNKENLVYGNSAELLRTYPKEYLEFTKERFSRGIRARIIVEKSAYGLREAARAKEELRDIKFLPEGKKFKSHTVIYGNRVMTLSWESMILVIIEDQANADNQRLVWELLWNSLK